MALQAVFWCATCLIDDAWDLLLRRWVSSARQQRLTPRSAEQRDERARRHEAGPESVLDRLRKRPSVVCGITWRPAWRVGAGD